MLIRRLLFSLFSRIIPSAAASTILLYHAREPNTEEKGFRLDISVFQWAVIARAVGTKIAGSSPEAGDDHWDEI